MVVRSMMKRIALASDIKTSQPVLVYRLKGKRKQRGELVGPYQHELRLGILEGVDQREYEAIT